MNDCTDYENDPLKGKRRVVCAAMKDGTGHIICGARHYDPVMHQQINNSKYWEPDIQQGFIDQWCNFMTREEAFIVANASGQFHRRGGPANSKKLFSEDIY